MPYYGNGTWYDWGCNAIINSTNGTDPISATVGCATSSNPTLLPIFLGFLYIILWVQFGNAPSRFKIVGITALVLVISIVMAAGGLTTDAVLNFIAFIIAFFLSFLFRS